MNAPERLPMAEQLEHLAVTSFDGFEWRPLRAAMVLSRITNREFDQRKLTPELNALSFKSLGALMEVEGKDEVSFREALASIAFSDADIEAGVQEVLEERRAAAVAEDGAPF